MTHFSETPNIKFHESPFKGLSYFMYTGRQTSKQTDRVTLVDTLQACEHAKKYNQHSPDLKFAVPLIRISPISF
jgi:hypothetical protein